MLIFDIFSYYFLLIILVFLLLLIIFIVYLCSINIQKAFLGLKHLNASVYLFLCCSVVIEIFYQLEIFLLLLFLDYNFILSQVNVCWVFLIINRICIKSLVVLILDEVFLIGLIIIICEILFVFLRFLISH